MKTLQKIEIVKWYVHVFEDEKNAQHAEVVGEDAAGNEYRTQNRIYAEGKWQNTRTDVICTDTSELKKEAARVKDLKDKGIEEII